MSEKGLAVSTAEMEDIGIVGNRVIKAQPKQNKISGILKIAVAVMVIISGLKMLKNRKQTG
ncbi:MULTISPECIES: hypothetical protein [Niastella]|uniref:Uncharacterized protein n=1 Tax=Niastella soli TaxID=2821487 RepID=A0ABS3YUU7_9BACT|nr:hypothetical protein [Niastella soli]MBO9201696.1 hypothetical protein [Niastella soli]